MRKDTVSIFAFTPFALRNGERIPLVPGNRKVRAVLSRACVIAPPEFFAAIPGVAVTQDEETILLTGGGNTVAVENGSCRTTVNGAAADFETPIRREKDYICLPVVETAKALGFEAAQFGQMAVVASEEYIEKLTQDKEELEKFTQKTCGVYNAAYFTKEDFKLARDAWRRELCGDAQTNDPSIPGMKNLLEMKDQDSEDLRRQMNRGDIIPILFGDEPPETSRELKQQYDRILRMAQPYGMIGCRGYKSKELLDDILYALDWMYDNMYGAKVLSDESYRSYKIFNWWEWYVGGACPMMDTVMIIEEDIGREMVDKYVLPMSFIRTQMHTGSTSKMTRILPLTALALLTEDRAMLQAVYIDETSLLDEHDSGDRMRRDWCCMTHGMPYNICYGLCNTGRVAKLLQVLDNTPLAFTIPKKYNLMNMARYTFAPVVYRGQGLNLMNGRYMQLNAGASSAISVLSSLHTLFGLFGEEEDRELYELIYRNATPGVKHGILSTFEEGITLEEYRKINVVAEHTESPKTHMASFGQYRDALTNPKYATAPYTLGYMWYSGDSCVQFRNDYMLGLRMNSKRSPGYECINSANGDAWYTGDGALYLYTPSDDGQYDKRWWECANKHLMPGTTVDARQRENMFFDRAWRSSQSFVGGVDLDKQFVAASMDYESFHCEVDEERPDTGYGRSWPIHKCTLTAKKSWFMFDRAVVAIGAEINAQDGYEVRTVVENRMLKNGLTGVLLNGRQLAAEPAKQTRDDVQSLYIPTAGGYIFPQGGKVTVSVYENDGETFISAWIEHGVNPENGSYAYIILPGADWDEVQACMDSGDIQILANTGKIQAVCEKHSGLTGMAFREAGELNGFIAEKPVIAMMKKTEAGMQVTICDPTQEETEFGFGVAGAKNAVVSDKCIAVEKTPVGMSFAVSCDSARGRGYRAEIEMA